MLPVLFWLVLSSCATTDPKQDAGGTSPVKPVSSLMSQKEQDTRALELFEQISEIFSESDRKSALPKAEALYLRIISEYPDAALGQESYWRLVLICLRDYVPPQYEKAEAYYGAFMKKYPQSPFRYEIEDAISGSYYTDGKWDKIMAFYIPAVKRYIETGKLDRPHDIFFYAEAKFNLGDLVEAEKGYKIVVSLFPKSREGIFAAKRLDELVNKKSSRNKP